MNHTTLAPIRLYDSTAPGSEAWAHEERRYHSEIFDTEVVVNVVTPTLTPVLPDQPGGIAVVVAPGGGYHALSIESEGFGVARWLAERGIAAFVLKYRLVPGGDDPVAELARKMESDLDAAHADMYAIAPLAAADAEAAIRLIRDRATEFGIDPARVGLMGFSAGGNLTMHVAYTGDDRARPNFIAPIYASVNGLDLVEPPTGSGPVFIVAATNDPLGLADDSVAIYDRWRRSGLAAELHMYADGGHGFGVRTQHLPSDTWIERFGDWITADHPKTADELRAAWAA
jgi:acetyl esterase/lipase